MPSIGFPELIVILMILLLVFGASRLPALGESLGRTIRGFKRGLGANDKIEIVPGDAKPGIQVDKNAHIDDAELIDPKKNG